ncbi:L-asparagine permease [Trichinella spiralis]|uniref:L-asparagine permease n=1 Tax=Trichinella spiralis TaxID=6334 RepID=A0ABR3KB90_TRISP
MQVMQWTMTVVDGDSSCDTAQSFFVIWEIFNRNCYEIWPVGRSVGQSIGWLVGWLLYTCGDICTWSERLLAWAIGPLVDSVSISGFYYYWQRLGCSAQKVVRFSGAVDLMNKQILMNRWSCNGEQQWTNDDARNRFRSSRGR